MRSILKPLILLALFVACLPVHAATIHVEKDGSGDFTVIQDAVDAAVDGDVIMIGPGRFDDYFTLPDLGDFRVIIPNDKSLTLQGAGADQTIIGPETYDSQYEDWGIASYSGPGTLRVVGIRLENLDYYGINTLTGTTEVENCVFHRCRVSIFSTRNSYLSVRSCQFTGHENQQSSPTVFARTGVVEVADSDFYSCRIAIQCEGGSDDVTITDCLFDGQGVGKVGIALVYCGGVVSNCIFRDLTDIGFVGNCVRNVQLLDNVFENIVADGGNPGTGVYLYQGGDSFFASGNVISETDRCFYFGPPPGDFRAFGNHFFRKNTSDGLYIEATYGWPGIEYRLDFANNFWGTTDANEIAQWIIDANDVEDGTTYVDFLPIADGPVSTESITLDGVKALFR